MFVKSYLFPPKCTPAILNNPVRKNPMPNRCFCKNRTTCVQILCLIPSTAICTFVGNDTTEKTITESMEPNSSSNFILINPIRSNSSSNTTSLLKI